MRTSRLVTSPTRPNQHRAVINDAAFSLVEEAAEYNSACVNTLRRSLDGNYSSAPE